MDDKISRARRAVVAGRSITEKAVSIRERIRTGDLKEDDVILAALLGSRSARVIYPTTITFRGTGLIEKVYRRSPYWCWRLVAALTRRLVANGPPEVKVRRKEQLDLVESHRPGDCSLRGYNGLGEWSAVAPLTMPCLCGGDDKCGTEVFDLIGSLSDFWSSRIFGLFRAAYPYGTGTARLDDSIEGSFMRALEHRLIAEVIAEILA